MLLDDPVLGKRITYYRKLKRLKQKDLASAVKIKKAYLCEIETGFSKPSINLLALIAVELGVSIEELLKKE